MMCGTVTAQGKRMERRYVYSWEVGDFRSPPLRYERASGRVTTRLGLFLPSNGPTIRATPLPGYLVDDFAKIRIRHCIFMLQNCNIKTNGKQVFFVGITVALSKFSWKPSRLSAPERAR